MGPSHVAEKWIFQKVALKLIYNKNGAYWAHHMSLKNSYHGKKFFWSKIDFLKNIDSYIKKIRAYWALHTSLKSYRTVFKNTYFLVDVQWARIFDVLEGAHSSHFFVYFVNNLLSYFFTGPIGPYICR